MSYLAPLGTLGFGSRIFLILEAVHLDLDMNHSPRRRHRGLEALDNVRGIACPLTLGELELCSRTAESVSSTTAPGCLSHSPRTAYVKR
jgi:hypothetical protein